MHGLHFGKPPPAPVLLVRAMRVKAARLIKRASVALAARQAPLPGLRLLWLPALAVLPPLLGLAVEQACSTLGTGLQELLSAALWPQDPAPVLPAPAFVEAEALPLRTSGRWLLDRHGKRVRLRCVNWYGAHLATLVVGGLDHQPLSKLAFTIRALGFNCVRLPYSLELQLRPARPAAVWLRANPELRNASGLEILDRTVKALAAARLLVVLNNHQGRAMWCCSEDDGEGLWYTPEYPEQAWLDSLRAIAGRYVAEPYVVAYDLRNEPRAVPGPGGTGRKRPQWGTGPVDTDWAAAALRGARAVAAVDPSALLVVEALHFAMDLSGLRTAGRLHKQPDLQGKVVYEAHDYCWYHPNLVVAWCLHWHCLGWALCLGWSAWRARCSKGQRDSGCRTGPRGLEALAALPYAGSYHAPLWAILALAWAASLWLASYRLFASQLTERWGFLLDAGEAPVWLGEFGTNGFWVTADWFMEVGEVAWWRHLTRFLREREVDYAYWAINGDKAGEDETFGLLTHDYSQLRHPWIVQSLP